jgi:DNA invertase Pin-like site-specific DNA recombinase
MGLDVQEDAIREWALQGDYQLVDVLREEGVSGTKELEERPALLEAFSALREGRASILVVARLDRLARDLIVQEQLLAEVKRLGASVCSASTGEAGYLTDDPDDPSRKLIRQVLGAVSEYERSMISLRLRSGRRHKASRGGYAHGSPPFGYRADNGALVPLVDEQRVVERILELRRGGATLRDIASHLNEHGYKPKRAAAWHPESVKRVLVRTRE